MIDHVARYEEFIKHLPVHAKDVTLIALKGHLLLETALKEFIYLRVRHPERLQSKQINFATLVDFGSSLAENDKISWVWKALRQANSIRNMLAHNLQPKELDEKIDGFIKYVEENDGEFSVEYENKNLNYERLSLVFFQVFDRLVINIERRDYLDNQKNNEYKSHSFGELLGGYTIKTPEYSGDPGKYQPPTPSRNVKHKY